MIKGLVCTNLAHLVNILQGSTNDHSAEKKHPRLELMSQVGGNEEIDVFDSMGC